MTRRRSSSKPSTAATVKKTIPANDVSMSDAGDSDWEINAPQRQPTHTLEVLEKDADEEALERLVLGDRSGFRAQLFGVETVDDAEKSLHELSLAVAAGEAKVEYSDADAQDELEDADDAHVFLYDDTLDPSTAVAAPEKTTAASKALGRANDGALQPAWDDSDDERLSVSLAGVSRLRKLRRTEDEDVVSGAEYAARLRLQFLRLHPAPAWAVEALKARQKLDTRMVVRQDSSKKKQARRRRSDGSGVSDSSDVSSSDDDEGGDVSTLPLAKFFRSTSAMASINQLLAQARNGGPRQLRPEMLDIQKTRDVATAHTGPVTALAFHPQYAVLLSASTSCTLHLHQVAPAAHPTPNPLLTTVSVRHTPVRRADFVAADCRSSGSPLVLFAGRRRFFHTWDLATGNVQRVSRVQGHALEQRSMERFRASPTGEHVALVASDRKGGGMLNILSVATMQWIAQARLDSRGGLADLQWWRDGRGLTLLGRDGRVGEWSLAARRFVGTWRDDGSTGGTVLALGGSGGPAALGGDRWVAIGSSSGITNLYDRSTLVISDTTTSKSAADYVDTGGPVSITPLPTPLRVFEQLTTPVTTVVFSPDGQLLAFSSQLKRDALRLAHLPSATVYRNWPTAQTPLGRITAVAFSRASDMLAVGNDVGKTRLWDIRG